MMRNLFLAACLILLSQFTFADGHTEIVIPNESFSVKGKLLNVELSDTGGVVTVSGKAGKYGIVYLTYNMKLNPNSTSQGSFTGRGMAIDDEGNRSGGVRNGVWTREGTTFTMHSLDDLSGGEQNLCKSVLDIESGEFEMTFYPI